MASLRYRLRAAVQHEAKAELYQTGTARGLRKEKKNREDGLLPWGLQARDEGQSRERDRRPNTVWGLARGPSPLCHVGRWPPTQLLTMADSLRPRVQSFTDSILSHRVFLYSLASTVAVSATVVNALQNQSNFYSVAVYLSKSGASVLVTSTCALSVYWKSNPPIFRSSPTSACCWH
jgi:hypothetical protein